MDILDLTKIRTERIYDHNYDHLRRSTLSTNKIICNVMIQGEYDLFNKVISQNPNGLDFRIYTYTVMSINPTQMKLLRIYTLYT